MLRSTQDWDLGSFLIFMISRDSDCWIYDLAELALTVGKYVLMIMVIILFPPSSSIHDQRLRVLNS